MAASWSIPEAVLASHILLLLLMQMEVAFHIDCLGHCLLTCPWTVLDLQRFLSLKRKNHSYIHYECHLVIHINIKQNKDTQDGSLLEFLWVNLDTTKTKTICHAILGNQCLSLTYSIFVGIQCITIGSKRCAFGSQWLKLHLIKFSWQTTRCIATICKAQVFNSANVLHWIQV